MKKIQYFKLFESRTARLSDEEFINLAKTKCKDFLASPKYLQRIKASFNGDYSYINPKLSHRNPLMKDEGSGGVFSSHHTLLMDNLPSWNGFPKRTQSIIGSTNFGFDPSFGDYYYCIIPYDGANFAVAPDGDLWNSSCKISGEEYKFDDYFSESFSQASISDYSYDEMMEDIQKLYDDYLSIVFYVNNVFQGYFGSSNIPSVSGSQSMRTVFGAQVAGSLYTFFKGRLDDIGIWNRALSQEEISNSYNANNCSNNLAMNTLASLPTFNLLISSLYHSTAVFIFYF
jgi:hypothetical protein